MLNKRQKQWLAGLDASIPDFIWSLARDAGPGRFSPCPRGATPAGEKAGLGFSCLALKTLVSVGAWPGLSGRRKQGWLDYIMSFQLREGRPEWKADRAAFADPGLLGPLSARPGLMHRLKVLAGRAAPPQPLEAVVNAETKQAIATLAEVGGAPSLAYQGFPSDPAGERAWMDSLPWEQPWAAGGRAAALAVYSRTQAPLFMEAHKAEALIQAQSAFYESMADPGTGAYFRGPRPGHGQLVNGAMKVLTALDWLGAPIHYPKALVDTCLAQLPSSEGCHLVDWVYVLYRAWLATGHRRREGEMQMAKVLDMIREHAQPDGGFSYYLGRSQTNYYGLDISKGLNEGDVHGTCLLAWALAMIRSLMDHAGDWVVIRP